LRQALLSGVSATNGSCVCFGSKADIATDRLNVGFTPKRTLIERVGMLTVI
jgi:hypothetical protein